MHLLFAETNLQSTKETYTSTGALAKLGAPFTLSLEDLITLGEAAALAEPVAVAKPGASTGADSGDVLPWETWFENVA